MQNEFEIVAKTFQGLEDILRNEVKQLGITKVEKRTRSVKFKGDWKTVYKANLHLRTAVKILVKIGRAQVTNANQLYNAVKKINWSRYISLHQTFSIETIGYTPFFKNTMFINQKAKDAIADQFREKYNLRPSIEKHNPDLPITLQFNKAKMNIYLNTSGAPLFKRGYKKERTVKAPLNEILAAAILQISKWDKNSPLIDPMCGSGTIPIEAALYAYNIPSNFYRIDFAFKNWKNFDMDLWTSIRDELSFRTFNERKDKKIIYGSDISEEAVVIAQQNASSYYNLARYIDFKVADFFDLKPEFDKATVIFNPPYGIRLSIKDRNTFYRAIGNKIKKDLVNYDVWIYTMEDSGIKNIGLKPLDKINLDNANLKAFLYHFKYEGK